MTNANLGDVVTRFGTDEKCRELLTRLRWPHGVECPRCKEKAIELETSKQLFYCKTCDYQFSVTAGSVFNDSHLPLTKWFMATLLLCEAKKGMSACQIQRTLGISYKTAWYLCHRIRAAMVEVEKQLLDGTVEMDETYVGGKKRGNSQRGGRGPRADKEIVVGIRQRNGLLRFFRAEDVKSKTLAQYIRENVSQDADVIITDELPAYVGAVRQADMKDSSTSKSSIAARFTWTVTSIRTRSKTLFRFSSAASWVRGTMSARNISRRTWKRCASDSIVGRVRTSSLIPCATWLQRQCSPSKNSQPNVQLVLDDSSRSVLRCA